MFSVHDSHLCYSPPVYCFAVYFTFRNMLLFLNFFLLASGSAVILKDPAHFPCQHYDLFDPISRIVSFGKPSTPDDFEHIAHQAVHQLSGRTNGMNKLMLARVLSQEFVGEDWMTFTVYTAESRCRNNGKSSQSLVECPLRETGRMEKCNLTVRLGVNRRVKLEHFDCVGGVSAMQIFLGDLKLREWRHEDLVSESRLLGFRAPSLENFKCYAMKFGKQYATEEEKLARFRNFQNNMKLAYFLQITEQGSGIYGPTKFSDLSATEFKKYATGLKPTSGWKASMKRGVLTPSQWTDLPEAFDWRNKSAVTPVKDQGQCGSCWAFSTTGNVEGQWAIKKGKLVSLSEQELVDCDSLDSGCGGGLPSNAYKAIIQLGGLETESDYPYDGRDDKCSFTKNKAKVYINDSVELGTDETELAQWLVKNGPISIGINANAMMLYLGGISHPWKIVCNPKNLDHGVLIVGYGTEGKKPYWIVKNSWGPGWGVHGYYLVYRGDGTCGLNQMCTSAVVA